MTLTMLVGAVEISFRAVERMAESISKMTSWSPIYLAKVTASCMAFASASRGPNGSGMHLLRAATIDPSWSRTATPIPIDLETAKTVASVLILYHGKFGEVHCISAGSL